MGQVRRVADEILVAVDSRVDPGNLSGHAAHADSLLRFDFAEPPERVWPWLLAQCSCDWILWLDGSEILSASVVDRLRELIRANDVVQYRLPSHKVDRDLRHAAAGAACCDEPRLVRNELATLWAPGVPGTVVERVFPARHLERGYYRLPAPEGTPNEVKGRTWARIPRRDRRLLAAAARAAAARDAAGAPPPATIVTRPEIDRHWPERPLDVGAYRASIFVLDELQRLSRRSSRLVDVRVTNTGNERWPGGARHPLVQLAHRWLLEDGEVLEAEGGRSPLPSPIDPGASEVIPIQLVVPPRRGQYVLELDLVHESVRWFGCTARAAAAVA